MGPTTLQGPHHSAQKSTSTGSSDFKTSFSNDCWLAGTRQVMVVTHSPQVAAKGTHHWLVSKSDADPGVLTRVVALGDAERKEEIARMLAGAQVTDEARAAADSLLEGASP